MEHKFRIWEKSVIWEAYDFYVETDNYEEAKKEMTKLVTGDFDHGEEVVTVELDDVVCRELYKIDSITNLTEEKPIITVNL